MRGTKVRRRHALLAGGVVALLAIAVPAIGADPSPAGDPRPPGQEKAKAHGKPDKGPALAKTVTGTIEQSTDAKGRPTFTVTVSGTTWELSAGPKWFHGDDSPLKAYVGRSVEIAGTHHEGETELDVETIDGQPIRAAGKPPWAGGPRTVGESHPGWKDWMADGNPGHGYGREHAPGQQKDKNDSGG